MEFDNVHHIDNNTFENIIYLTCNADSRAGIEEEFANIKLYHMELYYKLANGEELQ